MSFQLQVHIKGDVKQVFEAISKQLPLWWGNSDNPVMQKGDEFTISFTPTYWTFKVIEYEPFKCMEWKCIDASDRYEGIDSTEREWIGTTVVWVLEHTPIGTRLKFAHNGLEAHLNCYEACSKGWDLFVTESLKSFIETGQGKPFLV